MVSVFTSPYLSAGATALDEAKGLIYKALNILVFTTKEAVSIAYENNNNIFLDSTFKTVFSLYKQLLKKRIYSEKFNEFFTIFFILMTSKTKLLYKRALNVFLNF